MKLHTLLTTVSSAVVLSLLTLGPTSAAAQAVEVSLPNVVEDVGETIQIPVTVDDVTGKGITTFFLEITFDPSVLEFNRSIITNTLSDVAGAGKFDGSNNPGEFTVAYAAPATRPISGSGTLVLLEATVLAEGSTDLEFQIMQLNDGDVPSNTSDGFFSTQQPVTSDLGVELSATPGRLVIGEAFTLEADVSNAGPDNAAGVSTVITLPGSVSFTSASSGCTHSTGTVTCNRSSLASGASTTHTLTLAAPPAAGSVQLSAAVSSSALDPQDSNDEASITLAVESDADGISDSTEDSVPDQDGSGTGDGNGDGIPDKVQGNVASLPNATDGSYVTIEAPEGTYLDDISASATPPSGAPSLPKSVDFPDGYLAFEIETDAGAAFPVTVYTEQEVNSYFLYGPTPENATPHWYEFVYDGTTGAESMEDHIVLHFVDGGRGDADLSANGVVVVTGGPAFSANVAPIGADDAYTVDEDVTLSVNAANGLLANDSDGNADDLTVALVSDVEHGTLELNADGSFTYTPAEDFNGTDAFTYEVTDGLASDTANVTITVAAVNDPPGASVILTPVAGATVTIGGATEVGAIDGDAEAFTVSWTQVDDPEGDDVSYTLVVAEDAAFSDVIGAFEAGSTTEVSVSVAQAAQWFDAVHGSAELGATATVYVRVVTSDGSVDTEGESKSFVLVRGLITSVGSTELPDAFALQGNYPNPFNPSTEIVFDLPQQAQVTVDIYDALGRRVLAFPAQPMTGGAARSIGVDASALPSGAYVYRVTAEMSAATKIASGVMTLMK